MAQYYSVHGFVTIQATARDRRTLERLDHVLRYFQVDVPTSTVDVEIRDLDDFSLPTDAYNVTNVRYGFATGIFDPGGGYALELDRDKWTLYTEARNAAMVNPLIQWHLAKRQRSFVHSAGVSINGCGVIFPGFGGVGKTLLVSRLRHRLDARFFGDDYVIVDSNGRMYSYPQDFSIYPRHFAMFPELDRVQQRLRMTCARSKHAIAKLAKALLVKDLLRRMAQLVGYDYGTRNYLKIPVRDLIQESHIGDSVPLRAGFFLTRYNGRRLAIEPMDLDSLLAGVVGILQLEWAEMTRAYHALAAFGVIDYARLIGQVRDVLEGCFGGVPLLRVRIPMEMDDKDYVTELESHVLTVVSAGTADKR